MNTDFLRDCLNMIDRYPFAESDVKHLIYNHLWCFDNKSTTHNINGVIIDEEDIQIGIKNGKLPMIQSIRAKAAGLTGLKDTKEAVETLFDRLKLDFRGYRNGVYVGEVN